jgi:hypothetical protein
MTQETTMVRTYTDKTSFNSDEQQLGLEGWSVKTSVHDVRQTGVLQRIRSLFTSKPEHPEQFVVTYSRPRPT